MNVTWIKYRHGYSHGFTSWEYMDFPHGADDHEIMRWMEEKAGEHSKNNLYRGIHWERCTPPLSVVTQKIWELEHTILSATTVLAIMREYKDSLEANVCEDRLLQGGMSK